MNLVRPAPVKSDTSTIAGRFWFASVSASAAPMPSVSGTSA
jgi:hypothetical protein